MSDTTSIELFDDEWKEIYLTLALVRINTHQFTVAARDIAARWEAEIKAQLGRKPEVTVTPIEGGEKQK